MLLYRDLAHTRLLNALQTKILWENRKQLWEKTHYSSAHRRIFQSNQNLSYVTQFKIYWHPLRIIKVELEWSVEWQNYTTLKVLVKGSGGKTELCCETHVDFSWKLMIVKGYINFWKTVKFNTRHFNVLLWYYNIFEKTIKCCIPTLAKR